VLDNPVLPLKDLQMKTQSLIGAKVTINNKRGEYTGYSDITKKHHFSMYDGSVIKLDSLDGVKFDEVN